MGGAPEMIGMVMTVNPIKHLDRHSKEPSRFPFIDAVLHQPRRCSMAQGVILPL
jgi:hypothetical protein